MPGRNRTGPLGQGPRTGRGFGPCVRGFGRRGFAPYGYPQQVTFTKGEEKKILESELQELREDIKEIETRLKELK